MKRVTGNDGNYGRFVWIMGPEASNVKLWEPPKG
jgi:hypothetical protein